MKYAKYAVMLLLLCSYVAAKDDLADYPMTFHVDTSQQSQLYGEGLNSFRTFCLMGLSSNGHSYVVKALNYRAWCYYAGGTIAGNLSRNGNGQFIDLVHQDKKGKIKVDRYHVESEAAF